VGYTQGNIYRVRDDRGGLYRTQTAKFGLYAGLQAGLYYKLSEKWWVSGSLKFSEPFALDYMIKKDELGTTPTEHKTTEVKYRFASVFSIPAVGLGLRYFWSR
jgi:hypothetical protein